MPGETVDASIVFLPRYTTLVGQRDFTTTPLDVSQYSGVQFQVWRGSMFGGKFSIFLEESLDANTWVLGPSTSTEFKFEEDQTRFFSYSFRLRWFRIRAHLYDNVNPIVTCWAEGLLRGGGSGAWPTAASPLAGGAGVSSIASRVGGRTDLGSPQRKGAASPGPVGTVSPPAEPVMAGRLGFDPNAALEAMLALVGKFKGQITMQDQSQRRLEEFYQSIERGKK